MINKVSIYFMIWFAKMLYPKFLSVNTGIIYTQAKHETGDFESDILKENNNLFGMKQAKVRKNYATGTNRGHATYKSKWDSIRDYFERQKNFNIPTKNYMVETVNSGYAEDQKYLDKWTNLYNARGWKNSIIVIAVPAVLLVLGVLVFALSKVSKNGKGKVK